MKGKTAFPIYDSTSDGTPRNSASKMASSILPRDRNQSEVVIVEKHIHHRKSSAPESTDTVPSDAGSLNIGDDSKRTSTDFESFINLVKAALGAGVLSIPYAFHHIGFATGIFLNMFLCYVAYVGNESLIISNRIICRRDKVSTYSYAATVYRVLQEFGGMKQKAAGYIRITVLMLIASNLLGICMVGVGLTAVNLTSIISWIDDSVNWDPRVCMVMQLPLLGLLASVKSMKYMTPMSLLANVCLWAGLSFTLYYMFDNIASPSEADIVQMAPISMFPVFLSIAVYAYATVSVVLSLQNEMKNPSHLLGCPSVMSSAMVVLMILYTIYGALGYWRFGSEIQMSVLLNLNDEDVFALVIKIFMTLGIIFSFPLPFYVAFNMVWEEISKFKKSKWLFYLTKYSMVVSLIIANLIFPQLVILIALNGAITISMLQFIIPASLITLIRWEKQKTYQRIWAIAKFVFFIGFGLLIMVLGLYYAIIDIIQMYSSNDGKRSRSSSSIIYM